MGSYVSGFEHFAKFTEKHWSLFIATFLLKKKLQHKCFHMNSEKFFRSLLLQNSSKQQFTTWVLTMVVNKKH